MNFMATAQTLKNKLDEKYQLKVQLSAMQVQYENVCKDVDAIKKPLMDL